MIADEIAGVIVVEAGAGPTGEKARAEVEARAELARLGWAIARWRTRTPEGLWAAVARRVAGATRLPSGAAAIELTRSTPHVYVALAREARRPLRAGGRVIAG